MMRTKTKIWLVIASALMLLGLILLGGAMTVLKWDFKKLTTGKYETNEYAISKTFANITIVADTADIVFVPVENESVSVICYEQHNVKHSVFVADDTLTIEVEDTRKWYAHIGIHFGTPKITVSIPQGEYGALSIESETGDVELPREFQFTSIDVSESTGDVTCYASALGDVKIKTSTGNICVENIFAGTLDLSVTTGQVTAASVACEGDVSVRVSTGKTAIIDMTCKNILSEGGTGDLTLTNVIASEKFTLKRSTGDVTLHRCDAAELSIQTSTGDVTGSLLTEKVFLVDTDTGRREYPKTTTGGRCEITTDTGNIRISLAD